MGLACEEYASPAASTEVGASATADMYSSSLKSHVLRVCERCLVKLHGNAGRFYRAVAGLCVQHHLLQYYCTFSTPIDKPHAHMERLAICKPGEAWRA